MKKYLFAAILAIGVAALLAPPQAFAQEEKPFTIHGEIRWRGEYSNNTEDFLDTDSDPLVSSDDGGFYWPYRVRIAAEGHFTRNITGWIELQNTGVGGGNRDPRRNSVNSGDFSHLANDIYPYQANIRINQLWSKNFAATIGRQEIVLGSEFMMGDEDFYAGISHDGLTGMWDLKDWDITVWLTRPSEFNIHGYGSNFAADQTPDQISYNGNADNQDFFGGYAAWAINKAHNLDFYLTNFNDRGFGTRIQTLGARYYHDGWTKSQFFWNVELALQMGDSSTALITGGPTDVDAEGMGGEGWFGYSWKGTKNTHRVWGRFEYATGDDNSTTSDPSDDEGFFNPFGERHNRAGHGDWFKVQHDSTQLGGGTPVGGGLMAWALGYTGYFNQKHEVGAAYWDYSLEEDSGSLNGDELGQAFDLWYGYTMTKNLSFIASYSNLSPGDALTGTVAPVFDDSVERLYGQVRLRF